LNVDAVNSSSSSSSSSTGAANGTTDAGIPSATEFRCSGCLRHLELTRVLVKDDRIYQCPDCHKCFCAECDTFIHEALQNCPGEMAMKDRVSKKSINVFFLSFNYIVGCEGAS
jgi:hypothetical protein